MSHTIIIKDSVALYVDANLTERMAVLKNAIDPNTRTDNAYQITVDSLPAYYQPGGWTWDGEKLSPLPWYVEEILPTVKADKLQEINAGFEQAASALVATYPQSELLTFDQQTAEAQAYLADPTAECPMLAPLAAARGIEMADLCQRVMAKHAAFSAATGLLMGQRQAMEDRLELAETMTDVQAIEVAYSLPGAEAA